MSDEKVLIISSDCHAGALPSIYNEYMPKQYQDAANTWWAGYTREMISRVGTFFDQEAVEAYAEQAGDGNESSKATSTPNTTQSDEELLEMLGDPSNPFAPRRGEWDRRRHERRGDRLPTDGALRCRADAVSARHLA